MVCLPIRPLPEPPDAVVFDFDGVIADDEAETVYKRNNDLDEFEAYETEKRAIPHKPGPLADLFRRTRR